jgi:hypothetical protein
MGAKKANPSRIGRPRKPGGSRRGVSLYLPEKLIDRLRREADRGHRSLSEHVAYLLTRNE